MSHSQKYKRLMKRLGVKEAKPGALISKMHQLPAMPKLKHKHMKAEPSFKHMKHHKNPSSADGLKEPTFKHRKEMPASLEKMRDGEPEFKKHKHYKHMKMSCKHCKSPGHTTAEHAKIGHKHHKEIKLNPVSKGHKPKGAHGRAAVKALGRSKTTGNFAKIEEKYGKGAAINAYQNKLRAHQGK